MSVSRAGYKRHGGRVADRSKRSLKQLELARRWQPGLFKLAPLAIGAISATQRQAGEIIELMGRSTQAKVGLFGQAVRAAQDPSPFTSHARWAGFWLSALGLAQTNTATVIQIHCRAMNAWLRLMVAGR